jgi:hypothetical protein
MLSVKGYIRPEPFGPEFTGEGLRPKNLTLGLRPVSLFIRHYSFQRGIFWSLEFENCLLFVIWCLGFIIFKDATVFDMLFDFFNVFRAHYIRTAPGGIGCPRRKSLIESRFPDAP